MFLVFEEALLLHFIVCSCSVVTPPEQIWEDSACRNMHTRGLLVQRINMSLRSECKKSKWEEVKKKIK